MGRRQNLILMWIDCVAFVIDFSFFINEGNSCDIYCVDGRNYQPCSINHLGFVWLVFGFNRDRVDTLYLIFCDIGT